MFDHADTLPRVSGGGFGPVAGAPQPAPIERSSDPAQTIAFGLGLVLLFLRASMLHEIQTRLMGFNLRLLYIFGLPALLGVVVAGGIQRSLQRRTARYWVCFAVWIALTVPWSVWKMGSLLLFLTYVRVDLIMLFIVGGLVSTWRQCKLVMYAFAGAGVVDLLAARLFLREERFGGRFGLAFGSLANPDDFACHLLLTLPFLLWVAHSTKSVVLRLLALAGVGLGLYTILRTGSRGALVSLVLAAVFFLWRGTTRQRLTLLAGASVVLPVLVAVVPTQSLRRITSFSDDVASGEEAAGSTAMRKYLLQKSLEYTLSHPIFGVGAGQFSWAEGIGNRVGGTAHGYWHETHNTYMQVASECGIPALIVFLCGIVSTYLLLNSTYRQARRRPDCEDIAAACFFTMLGMAAFCTAIFFLSFAYLFYLPALAGLAIALDRTARAEFSSRDPQALGPQQPPWGGPPRSFDAGAGRIPPGPARPARQAAS